MIITLADWQNSKSLFDSHPNNNLVQLRLPMIGVESEAGEPSAPSGIPRIITVPSHQSPPSDSHDSAASSIPLSMPLDTRVDPENDSDSVVDVSLPTFPRFRPSEMSLNQVGKRVPTTPPEMLAQSRTASVSGDPNDEAPVRDHDHDSPNVSEMKDLESVVEWRLLKDRQKFFDLCKMDEHERRDFDRKYAKLGSVIQPAKVFLDRIRYDDRLWKCLEHGVLQYGLVVTETWTALGEGGLVTQQLMTLANSLSLDPSF